MKQRKLKRLDLENPKTDNLNLLSCFLISSKHFVYFSLNAFRAVSMNRYLFKLVYEKHSRLPGTVLCTLYTVHCTLYTVHCTLYTVHCTLCTVHCTLYSLNLSCTLLHKLIMKLILSIFLRVSTPDIESGYRIRK